MISLIIGLALFIIYFVGWVQIITKAGYSPWWIVAPLSIPVLWFIEIAIVFNGFGGIGSYGAFNVQAFADQGEALAALTFLDVVGNFILFVIFAFSEWPVMRAARTGYSPRGGGFASSRPSYGPGPDPSAGGAFGVPADNPTPTEMQGQQPGWQRSGIVGAGEQSYWD